MTPVNYCSPHIKQDSQLRKKSISKIKKYENKSGISKVNYGLSIPK